MARAHHLAKEKKSTRCICLLLNDLLLNLLTCACVCMNFQGRSTVGYEALRCVLAKLHNASHLFKSFCVMKYLIDKNAAVIYPSWERRGLCECVVVLDTGCKSSFRIQLILMVVYFSGFNVASWNFNCIILCHVNLKHFTCISTFISDQIYACSHSLELLVLPTGLTSL